MKVFPKSRAKILKEKKLNVEVTAHLGFIKVWSDCTPKAY